VREKLVAEAFTLGGAFDKSCDIHELDHGRNDFFGLTNLLGQKVKSWNMSEIPNSSNNEFRIPVNTISEGYYIIKVETNSTTIRKKVIISNDF
jgi:hypothetical protein